MNFPPEGLLLIFEAQYFSMKFSGHDTFACRTPWLYKGLELLNKQVDRSKDLSVFSKGSTTVELGVGKNMLNAIKHWLLAFGIIEEETSEPTLLSSLIFAEGNEEAIDLFVEDRFTLWLLHFEICQKKYATIYHYFFQEYFKRKSTRTFSETDFINALKTWIVEESKYNLPSENSLRSDFRCLIDTYCIKIAKSVTYEDNYTTLLGELGLIKRTDFRSDGKEVLYELNSLAAMKEPVELFAALLIKAFGVSSSKTIDDVYSVIGTALLLTREDLSHKLEALTQDYSAVFSFRSDAGVQELQINSKVDWFQFAIENYYRK